MTSEMQASQLAIESNDRKCKGMLARTQRNLWISLPYLIISQSQPVNSEGHMA